MKATIRVIRVFAWITGFVIVCMFRALFKGQDWHWTTALRQRLVKQLFRILRVELHYRGAVPTTPSIFVANHRSYLDPVIMHRHIRFVPVAKAEVGAWPIIGHGAKVTGILYVQRESKDSRKETREAMGQCVKDGYHVVVYPEGTTHLDPQTREFRPGTFYLAAQHPIPLVPVALDYDDPEIAWVGADTFLPHLLKICRKKKIVAYLSIGKPLLLSDAERLKTESQAWIDQQLGIFRDENRTVQHTGI